MMTIFYKVVKKGSYNNHSAEIKVKMDKYAVLQVTYKNYALSKKIKVR